jgi:nucleotide-binding universal stress UspA family protein
MFANVLVGIDGREGGRDALALARVLRGTASKLTLAYVYNGREAVWHGPRSEPESVARFAHELLQKARDQGGSYTQTRWCQCPSIGKGLHQMAEEIGADLLVVGSSRRGLLGRVALGNDTVAALNGAPCAVAIAPAGYIQRPARMREIGVGYDGSPESKHALRVARAIAAQHGAKLSAFEAVLLPMSALSASICSYDSLFENMLADAREEIAALGGVEARAAFGDPAEELALYGASLDLLVIGSRGYGPLGRLVHGSTAQELARSARCPLLTLTRAAREADAARRPDDGGAAAAADAAAR